MAPMKVSLGSADGTVVLTTVVIFNGDPYPAPRTRVGCREPRSDPGVVSTTRVSAEIIVLKLGEPSDGGQVELERFVPRPGRTQDPTRRVDAALLSESRAGGGYRTTEKEAVRDRGPSRYD